MRILFLINNLNAGGAERTLVNLANGLVNLGYTVTVRSLIDTGINRSKLNNNVNYESVFNRGFKGLNYLYLLPKKYIYHKICYGEFDIIVPFLHGVLTKIVSYAPKEQKIVAWLHANMEESPFIKSFKSKKTIRKCFKDYRKIISVSYDVQHSFIRATNINDNRLKVIYNVFDVNDILEKSKESVEITKHNYNICSVGKLENVKGYLRLIKVIKQLSEEDIDIHLTIVGEGIQRNELEHYISDNKLNDRISLIGFDDNPYRYIARSDLFVCSSYSEGFSSVVCESLIIGTPVLTTNCAGMREILGNNEYGIITENNEKSLYMELKRLLTEPLALTHYAQKAKERSMFFAPKNNILVAKKMFEEIFYE